MVEKVLSDQTWVHRFKIVPVLEIISLSNIFLMVLGNVLVFDLCGKINIQISSFSTCFGNPDNSYGIHAVSRIVITTYHVAGPQTTNIQLLHCDLTTVALS